MSLLFTSPLIFSLAKLIYPLSPLIQAQTLKQLQVLALGLPRSGTDSIRTALEILGYDGISHGFEYWLKYPEDGPIYAQLAALRNQNRLLKDLETRFFDRILGRCEAVTDIPAVWFSHGLLAAYPDARVILNRRKDVNDWKRSFEEKVLPLMQSWQYWWTSFFDAELFWGMAITLHCHGTELFQGDFEENAGRRYVEHCEGLERELERHQRRFLRWGVEDGWEPLCEFLGKDVPIQDFPRANLAAEFASRAMQRDGERMRNYKRNAVKVLSVVVVSISVGLWMALARWASAAGRFAESPATTQRGRGI